MRVHKASPDPHTCPPTLKRRLQVLFKVFFPRSTCNPPISTIIASLKGCLVRPAYSSPISVFFGLPEYDSPTPMNLRQIVFLACSSSSFAVVLQHRTYCGPR